MKETLKFLKLGLIGAVSVAAISALTVSCSINKETVNNNQDVQKPGTGSTDSSSGNNGSQTPGQGGNNGSQTPDQGGNNIKPEDLLVLQQALDGFNITKREGIDFTNVLATSINEDNFLEYFVETIGSGFETEKGFTYTCKSVKVNAVPTKLDVVYEISYKGATLKWTKTIDGFEPLLPNPGGSTIQQLTYAKEKFSITTKKNVDYSNVRVNEITNENIGQYFSLDGKVEGLDYHLSRIETIGDEQIIIYYKIKASDGMAETKQFIFGGFKGLNLIDYNPSIALDLSELNKIAFLVQQYSEEEKNKYIQDGGWSLNLLNGTYEATNTNKYIMISDKKYYVWKLKFTTQNPISTSNGDLPFTQKGQKWHDDNGGFSMAFEEGTTPNQK